MKIVGFTKTIVGVLVTVSTIGGFIVAIMQFNQGAKELGDVKTQTQTQTQTNPEPQTKTQPNTYVWENPDMFRD
jgi:hypothetical protein